MLNDKRSIAPLGVYSETCICRTKKPRGSFFCRACFSMLPDKFRYTLCLPSSGAQRWWFSRGVSKDFLRMVYKEVYNEAKDYILLNTNRILRTRKGAIR